MNRIISYFVITKNNLFLVSIVLLSTILSFMAQSAPTPNGHVQKWHPLTLTFEGPESSETADSPNPFLDYRLQVHFTAPRGVVYNVPGFYDGNGKDGDTGTIWKVCFSPDEAGKWSYKVSFRSGDQIAVSLDPNAGKPLPLNGTEGHFTVTERDPNAPGFLKWGRLEYVGKFYLKFRDGSYWIRGGADSPENFLAYAGFDNTPPSHRYALHKEDWQDGDPDWNDGKGKAIIGALNYLAGKNVNSIYALTMNIGGDGKDVWPWSGKPDPEGNPKNDNLHFDISKLHQWNIVFDHAQRNGIFLHLVLNEAEAPNKKELDEGELGVERKLYYRELIARFGHHLALEWNLCEEYNIGFDFGPERIRQFASYIGEVDPYHHPITVHSAGNPLEKLRFMFGDERFDMTSIQLNQRRIDTLCEEFRQATKQAGRPLPVSMDEFTVDQGQRASHIPIDNADAYRKQKLWPVYLSGGMIEFILEGLLQVDDFKSGEKDKLWEYVWYARKFMEENLPFWEMEPADELVTGEGTIPVGLGKGKTFELDAQVFSKTNEIYAVYLPIAHPTGSIDLSQTTGTFELRWYNPRTGRFEGKPTSVEAGKRIPLDDPPKDKDEDWVVFLKKND